MTARLVAIVVSVCLSAGGLLGAQTLASLSRQQRELLHAVVLAVDAAADDPETSGAMWQLHVMRASDGSHYVAFSVEPPAVMAVPAAGAILYVRLAHAAPFARPAITRSPIREWLAGETAAPPPVRRAGVVLGEMPVMGATGNLQERPPTTPGMVDLQLQDLERRRAREREEERRRQQQAVLEGAAPASTDVVPFEDFDALPSAAGSGRRGAIARAFTAGPGDFFLYAAWADPSSPKAKESIRVLKKAVRLPNASAQELALSSVIVADAVRMRDSARPSETQAANPYSFGAMEITPAHDSTFTPDEKLNLVFQVINPRGSNTGKPDIDLAFRIVRVNDAGEEPVATLTPQDYSAATLPADFDLRAGHPLLATLSAPLQTLSRGSYRLRIVAKDAHAGGSAEAAVDFSIAATAASLLREAPPVAAPFERQSVLGAEVIPYVLQALKPATPSPALERAFDAAQRGRFVDLMSEPALAGLDDGLRAAFTGLSLLAVGDGGGAAVQFQRAALLGAPIAPLRLLSGAARAMQGRDVDAIGAWREAVGRGAPLGVVGPLLIEGYLRRGEHQQAGAVLAQATAPPPNAAWARARAATLVAAGKEAEALGVLERHLKVQPDDATAQWLRLHARFSLIVRGEASHRDPFLAEAKAYVDANGTHARLAGDWVAQLGRDK